MLRVMESLRAAEGEGPIEAFYWEVGKRIHHDGDRDFAIEKALSAIGVDTSHADAAEDEKWDPVIEADMAEGLALTGDDIGTPLLAFDDDNGKRQGIFGPVITRVPGGQDSLDLWDAMVTMTKIPGFWELKRTRTEPPEFGERP